MAWNYVFYGVMILAVLWIISTFCWAFIRLCKNPRAQAEDDDDTASYVTIPDRQTDRGQSCELPNICRDSLRHRNSTENFSYDDTDAVPNSTSESSRAESSGHYESSGQGSIENVSVKSNIAESSSVNKTDEKDNTVSSKDDSGIKSINDDSHVSEMKKSDDK